MGPTHNVLNRFEFFRTLNSLPNAKSFVSSKSKAFPDDKIIMAEFAKLVLDSVEHVVGIKETLVTFFFSKYVFRRLLFQDK